MPWNVNTWGVAQIFRQLVHQARGSLWHLDGWGQGMAENTSARLCFTPMSTSITMPISTTKTLLIVYHSQTGGTLQMAQAARDGALAEEGVSVRLLHAAETQAEDVLTADGLVFATPENLAAISGQLKDFFDRSYYAVLDRINGRPYAALICAGSDGHNATRQIERIATGWRLKPVAEPLIVCTHAQTPEAILAPKQIGEDDLARCRALGESLAAGLVLGVF